MLVVGILLILLSNLVPAPIAAAMTENNMTGESRAPWFFLWVQQMLKWGDPFLFGVLVPLGMFILLTLIPYIFRQPNDGDIGKWFPKSNRIAQIIVSAIAFVIIAFTLLFLFS